MSLRADPEVLKRAISRMVSTDSCFAVSMKLQVLTTRISASSGWAVRRAPARSSRPIITSESTRFLGQPKEIRPTVGAVGGASLVTLPLYREWNLPFFSPQGRRLVSNPIQILVDVADVRVHFFLQGRHVAKIRSHLLHGPRELRFVAVGLKRFE